MHQRSASYQVTRRFQGAKYQGPTVGPWYFLWTLALLACRSEASTSVQYGEPVGVKLAGGQRPIELAIALSKGKDPQPLLGALVDMTRAGLDACPGYLSATPQDPSPPVAIRLSAGKVTGAPEENTSPEARCMVKALTERPLPPPLRTETDLHVLVQARILSP
ncbi:MAG: hypothetical protein MUF64_15615 [Polyangiaceae bacterium]|nr:hypothetical protein [Polyangiaceae bacterium]